MSRNKIDNKQMTRDVIRVIVAIGFLVVLCFLASMCRDISNDLNKPNTDEMPPYYPSGDQGEGYSKGV